MDVVNKNGDKINTSELSRQLGCKVVEISALKGEGVMEAAEEAIKRANERIKNSTVQAINSTVVGYTSCLMLQRNIRFSEGKINYALLPVYVFSTTYKGKIYTFAMNGQTGKFTGNLPSDTSQVIKYSLISFAICFVVILLLLLFLMK